MNRFRLKNLAHVGLAAWLLCLPACQKKCQDTSQPHTTFVGLNWKMVSSTNPSVVVDKYNFSELEMASNFTGTLKRYVNNAPLEEPVATLRYSVDPSAKTISIEYTYSDTALGVKTIRYGYNLDTRWTLTEQGTSNAYGFVQFDGNVIDPTDTCTY